MIRSILESLKNNKNKLIAIFLAGFLLSACNQEHDNIEADDFGFPKKVIYAKGKNVTGEEENQLSEWIPTGYRYNGDQVVIMVYNRSGTKSTWNSWFCAQEDSICDAMLDAPSCQFPEGYCHEPGDIYETINNAPCYLEKGEGLYLLITDPNSSTGITDPNTYDSVNRLPSSANFYTKHLTDKTSMYHNGVVAHGYSGELTPISVDPLTGDETVGEASTYLEGEAYFKILDRYYEDNSGYQKVSMKRGFDQIIPPPIASIIDFVTDTMDETAESMYRDIVAGSEYRLSLKILLVLYIVVHGILYIGGASDMSQSQMISMFIRMIIVIQLTTGEESWKLFNDYFFKFFTEGLEEMISIVTSNLSDGTGDSITFFDKLLGLLFSYETSVKIYASIWSYPSGFIVAIVTYVAFAMFAIAIAKAVMLYLLSYMAISLLIIVAPIFICFMLFETTKSLFENWINQFAVFFLQSVMVLAALNLLAQIIVDQIYMMYGFKACFEDWMFVGSFVIAKSWFICSKVSDTPNISGSTPAEVDQTCSDTLFCNIEVPGYGYNDPLDPERYCEPYECMDYRHAELPFLDPDVSREADLIDAFQSLSSLSTPMLYEACILLLMCYLMLKFNDVVPGLAKGIAGGGGGTPAIANAANSITQDFKSTFSGAKNLVGKAVTGMSEKERGSYLRKSFNESNVVQKIRGSGIGKAASTVYKTAGFIKDTIIPPGSLTSMIQNHSAEEAQSHRNKLRDARESQRMADANEGYVYDKSYMDQRQDSYEERSYVAGMREKIRQGSQKFDLDNAEAARLGKAKTTIHVVFAQKVGEKLYETKAGKAVYDGFVGKAQLFKDEIKKFGNSFKKRSDELAYKGSAEYAKEQARKWEADRPAREAREKQTGEAYADLGLDKKRLASLSPARRREIVKEAYTRLGMEYYRARDNGDLTADQKLQKVEAAYQYLDSLGDHKRANQLQNEAVRNDNKPTGIPSILEKGMDKPRENTSERTQEEYKASYLERYEKDMVREKANQDNLLVNEALDLRLNKKEQLLYDLLDKDPEEQKEIAKKALNKSLDNLNFSKKDILLFNTLNTKGQQEMIQDALNKSFDDLNFSKKDKLLFDMVDKQSRLEMIEEALQTKEINEQNYEETYRAYRAIKTAEERKSLAEAVVDSANQAPDVVRDEIRTEKESVSSGLQRQAPQEESTIEHPLTDSRVPEMKLEQVDEVTLNPLEERLNKKETERQNRKDYMKKLEDRLREESKDAENLISSLDQGMIIAFYEKNKDKFEGAKFADSSVTIVDDATQKGFLFGRAVYEKLYPAAELQLVEKNVRDEAVKMLIQDTLDGRLNSDYIKPDTEYSSAVIDKASGILGLSKEGANILKQGLLSKAAQIEMIDEALKETNRDKSDAQDAKDGLIKVLKLNQQPENDEIPMLKGQGKVISPSHSPQKQDLEREKVTEDPLMNFKKDNTEV